MKLKRSITIPIILLAYLVGMSIYTWPGKNPNLSYTRYGLTIGITFVCILVLSYFLKKRDDLRDKNKNNREK